MTRWADLEEELTLWRDAGLVPRLWWRDDDAQAITPELETLLALSEKHAVPLHLSVIPEGVSTDLAQRLRNTSHTWVLQHGFAHRNHEPKGLPASEMGQSRDIALQLADLQAGWDTLEQADMPRLLRGFVPPWNRINDETRRKLPELGYRFLSAYEGRGDEAAVPGLCQLDAHLDPIRWKFDRVFRGEDKMLDMLISHLQARRTGAPDDPIGYVTHHLQTNDAIWRFTDELLARTQHCWFALPELDAYNG